MTRHITEKALQDGVSVLGEMGIENGGQVVHQLFSIVDDGEDAQLEDQLQGIEGVAAMHPDHVQAVRLLREHCVSVLVARAGEDRDRVLDVMAELHVRNRTVQGFDPRVLRVRATRRARDVVPESMVSPLQALGYDETTGEYRHDFLQPFGPGLIIVDFADLLDRDTLRRLVAARGCGTIVLTRDPDMEGSSIPASTLDVEMDAVRSKVKPVRHVRA